MSITNFTIFKVKDHDGDEKKPTHNISTKVGEKYEYIGSCWTKEKDGNKYLSCSLNKPYNDKLGYTMEIIPEKNNAHKEPEEGASPTAFDEAF